MSKCELCGKEFSIFTALCVHLSRTHNIKTIEDKKQYYDTYLKKSNEGKCLYCGKSTEFTKWAYKNYCNRSCQFKHNKAKMLTTMKNKYGAEYAAQSSICRKKMENTCLERYGVRNCLLTDESKKKAYNCNQTKESKQLRLEHTKQTVSEKYSVKSTLCLEKAKVNSHSKDANNKRKQTSLNRYGVENPAQSDKVKQKIKQTTLERYGVEYSWQIPKIQKLKNSSNARRKAAITMRKNGNKSKAEDLLIEFFRQHHIQFKTEYSSDAYPFNCDFYLPETDTYIELNIFPMHGGHFYDSTNANDILKVQIIKEKAKTSKWYEKMVEVWLDRDVRKHECAIKNKLNYIVIWNYDELYNYITERK